MSLFKRGFVKYHAGSKSLTIHVGKEEPGDLSVLLRKYKVKSLDIEGTPTHLSAISEHPGIEELRLSRCKVDNLRDLTGLSKLKRFSAAFGDLAEIDLEFCRNTIETINFFMVGRVKSLKRMTRKPMPRLWLLSIDSMRSCEPPDFRLLPKLKQLAVRNHNWPSLNGCPSRPPWKI